MNTDKDLELAEDVVNKAKEKQDNVDEIDSIYSEMINNLNNFIISNIDEESTKLESLSKTIDKKDYFISFYRKEFLEELRNKFFNREYVTEPEKRIENIRIYVEDKTYRFEMYLNSIEYDIKTSDDIEMFEKNDLSKIILTEYTEKPVFNKSKAESFENYKEKKKERFSNILDMIEEEEIKDNEEIQRKKELQAKIDNAPLSEKIDILYKKCVERAISKDGEEDGLIYTYITDIYNPETTVLDEANLYYNLTIIDTLQSFNIIDWNFDTAFNDLSEDQYDLSMKHWKEIMEEEISDDKKYFKILDKNSKYAIYSTIIHNIGQDFNRDNLNKRDLKLKNLFVDDKDETSSMEQLLIHAINKKSEEGDIVMITPDMKEFVDIDKENKEEMFNNDHIKLLGEWRNRWMLEVTPDNFKPLKGLKKACFHQKGNRYNINPEKPLAHFHIIDNPLLSKPKLKVYFNLSMKFFMSNTTIMFVDDLTD